MVTREELAMMVDHTNLDEKATDKDIEILVQEAVRDGYGAICIRPDKVIVAKGFLRQHDLGGSVKIASVVGFPKHQAGTAAEMIKELSDYTTKDKVIEADYALSEGASEIDMVIDLAAMKRGNYATVERDIRAVVKAASDAPVKVIIETCYLSEPEKEHACRIAEKAGAAYVKTSTGYGAAGAAIEDILLMSRILKPIMGIKASGGIHKWEFALKLYEASQEYGSHPFRIGASKLD